MAKEPAQRFQSADEFREALEEILAPISETQPRGASVVPIAFGSRAPVAQLAASTPVSTPIVRPIPGAGSGAITVPASSRWGLVELGLAGVFMFIVVTAVLVAFLTIKS